MINDLLASLPPAYPVDNVVVDGESHGTSNFVSLQNGLAYFTNGSEIKVFNVSSIDGLDLT